MSADPGSNAPSGPCYVYPFGSDLTPRRIDFFLFNRTAWRRVAEQMEPRIAAALDPSGVRGRGGGSKVEQCAIDRATIFLVLDALDRAMATVPVGRVKRAMSWKFDRGWTHDEICRQRKITHGQLRERLDFGREWIAGRLRLLPGSALADFSWAARTVLPRMERHRISVGQYCAITGKMPSPLNEKTPQKELKNNGKGAHLQLRGRRGI